MKTLACAMACALSLSACFEQANETLPPFSTIEKATLDYANCVDASARRLATKSSAAENLAQQAVGSCQKLRRRALALKSVPIFYPTVAEFDATHLGLAQQTVESARAK